ncbi:uncharacterized protein LOC134723147 [Mytilus trossulus]|uniref:uncharacterized protein LOC134723147 n=1 Tax=Mytilus trossulus TaxID=6551 RepID=UPI003007804E
MGDQSNTHNDINTHEVSQEFNSRSEINPEFQGIIRMTSEPETDGESCPVAGITEGINGVDIIDAVIIYAENDRQLALEFIQNMETEFPKLQLDLKLSEQFGIGRGILGSAPDLFRTCRFIFVFETNKMEQDKLSDFVRQMFLYESITVEELNNRLVPILNDDYYISILKPLIHLKYNRYLEGRSQNRTDHGFIKSFEDLILHGRRSYLIR